MADGIPMFLLWQMVQLIFLLIVGLFEFKFWDVKQNIIPNIWQMVFTNDIIEGWNIDPYINLFI